MPIDLQKARELFLHAVGKLPPEQWENYVAEACGGDAELEQHVEGLLQVHREAGSFLDAPAPGLDATIEPSLTERPGTQIGPYKLLQQIGEGGMGTVFMAEQTRPVKRQVALKVIKPGMDSRQIIARFEAERQALAMMDHVNIARVLDAGTTESGRPYFVMELVHGVPITKYCDDNQLTPRERLELFVPVCQAIQHAHQKGIIHRDIKPSNVMITLYDGKPVPKVIDFGVAKATDQKLTERTLFTQYGTMVGTLEYMSPEQAEMSALGVDTRSDIYSLGVLLYELLTGSTPLSHKTMKEAAYAEILRLIKEEEPPKPSTRLSDSGEALASISAQRHMEPAKLTKLMRGELDWIVMKTLEKDRRCRYETASGFAADVQRYLADEPVQACPPSAMYRFRKFARRNKRALASAAVLVLAVLVVAGTLGWAVRDREAHAQEAARERAARQTAVEQEVNLALKEAERWQEQEKWPEALSAAKRAQGLLAGGGSDQLRERVFQLSKDLELMLRLEDIGLLATEIETNWHEWDVVDEGYARAFADYGIDVLNLPVEEAAARIRARDRLAIPLARTLDVWAYTNSPRTIANRARIRAVAGAVDSDPWLRQVREAVQERDGKTLAALAGSPNLAQQARNSLVVLQHGLKSCGLSKKSLDVLRMSQRHYPGDFWVNYWLANELYWSRQSDHDEVVSFARAAVAIRPKCAAAHLLLALSLQRIRKYDEAVAYHHKAIEFAPNNAYPYHDLGWTLHFQGKYDEAIVYYRKAIELWATDHFAYLFLGRTLRAQKKLDEAVAAFRKAVEINPTYVPAYIELGNALRAAKKLDEAVAAYRRAVELEPKTATRHYNLGIALYQQGKLDEAIACYRKAIELDPKDAKAHGNLGSALAGQKKLDEAIACYKKAIELDPKYAAAYSNLGNALYRQAKQDEAIARLARLHAIADVALYRQAKLDEAIACYRKAIALDPKCAAAHCNLGGALFGQGKVDEAIASYKKAIELDPKLAIFHSNLGNALLGQRKLDEAITCFRKAIELNPKLALAHSNLGNALYRQGKQDEAIACFRKVIELNPKNAELYNNLAWLLATGADPKFRDSKLAVELARKAVELVSKEGTFWNTLGVAHYRAGEWKDAIDALKKSDELLKGEMFSFNAFFLAMAHWRLDEKDEARKWYDQAVAWMEKNKQQDEELKRFREEATELLGVKEKKD